MPRIQEILRDFLFRNRGLLCIWQLHCRNDGVRERRNGRLLLRGETKKRAAPFGTARLNSTQSLTSSKAPRWP
jgi:hypothetical protein